MAEPNIVAFRIDERLIHGQGQLWIKALGANTVIVADDGASEDPMQQMLMKAVVPKTIAMRFFSVQHTCDVIMKASPKQTIFIVCKTPADALRLVKGGVPVKEINVGNIHRAPGKEEISEFTRTVEIDQTRECPVREMGYVGFWKKIRIKRGNGESICRQIRLMKTK